MIFLENGIRCYKSGMLGGPQKGRLYVPKPMEVPKKYNCELMTAEQIDSKLSKRELQLGIPNMRTHIPFYQEGDRYQIPEENVTEPDDQGVLEASSSAAIRHGAVYTCPNEGTLIFLSFDKRHHFLRT